MATKAELLSVSAQQLRLTAGQAERLISLLVAAVVVAAVVYGWINREHLPFVPQHGFGYFLGIAGGSMMLILLAYPLRKRSRTSRKVGSVSFWFRFHMLLGLLGPVAILFHARFSWGALNSAMALGAMIIVASSGVVGRYFYSRVHRGYSGRKLELRALKQEMDGLLTSIASEGMPRDEVIARLQPFEDSAVKAGGAFWSSARAVLSLGIATRRTERQLLKSLPRASGRKAEAMGASLADYFEAVRRAAEFAFYDRLLRLWHLLHLPLFVLLVAAAILHIVAVHMY